MLLTIFSPPTLLARNKNTYDSTKIQNIVYLYHYQNTQNHILSCKEIKYLFLLTKQFKPFMLNLNLLVFVKVATTLPRWCTARASWERSCSTSWRCWTNWITRSWSVCTTLTRALTPWRWSLKCILCCPISWLHYNHFQLHVMVWHVWSCVYTVFRWDECGYLIIIFS